jgi:hypothetical protein
MEATDASSAIPGFSSLSLSRPDSYSAAGRVADASIPVLKQPQPMLYSPTSGLGELCCLQFSSTVLHVLTQQHAHASKGCTIKPPASIRSFAYTQHLHKTTEAACLAAVVAYEPPGLTGVAHMQWLERLSSPKVNCSAR